MAIAIFLPAVTAPGLAQNSPPTYAGNFWIEACDLGIRSGDEKLCTGFFQGLIGANDFLEVSTKRPWFCLPEGASTRQLYETVKRDLDPTLWADPFAWHAIAILARRFPCNK